MAPINPAKRRLPQTDHDEDDVGGGSIADGSADEAALSSGGRRDSRKKARLSIADEEDMSVSGEQSFSNNDGTPTDSIDDDEEDDDAGRSNNHAENGEVYEDQGDGGDLEASDYRDLDDDTAMQRLRGLEARSRRVENHAADNAIIEEVVCTNFMCHAHLAIKMGPLINFIIGHNGSGKSAVLTALTLCLGGKATATNRGQNLKQFIKEGREAASLTVRIKNQGVAAYKPEIYGSAIVVERHFSRSGASGFKLKTASGKLISNKRSELEEILDFFALQLDNPMNVLTQDMARQFLNSSSPQDKYRFFHRGTQLERLDHDYRATEESLDRIEARIVDLGDARREAKEAYEHAHRQAKKAQSQVKLRDSIATLRRQLMWKQVEIQEAELKKIDDAIADIEDSVQLRIEAAEDAGTVLEQADRVLETAKERLSSIESELAPVEEKRKELDGDFNAKKVELADMKVQQRQIMTELKAVKANVRTYEDKIAQEEKKLEMANDGRHAELHNQIQDRKTEFEVLEQELKDHNAQYRPLEVECRAADDALKKADDVVNTKRDEVQGCQGQIRELEKDDGMSRTDPSLNTLLKAIDQDTRFRSKPVGPMWRYVRLLKAEWSSILETSFGAVLNAFCVTSKPDQVVLSGLMNKCGYRAQILIGNPRPLDVSRHAPASQYATWLSVLKIDNDLVRNQIIINQGAEQTVLIRNRNEANRVNLQKLPNIRQVFCFHDTERGAGTQFANSAAGPKSGPIRAWQGRPRMLTDVESRVNLEKENLADLKREYVEAENAQKRCRSRSKEALAALTKHKRDGKELKIRSDSLDDEISKLNDELDDATPQTGVIEQLRRELESAKERRDMNQNTIEDSALEKDGLDAALRELLSKRNEIGEEIDVMKEKISKAENRVKDFDLKRQNALLSKNESYAKIDDAKAGLAEKQQERETQLGTVEEFNQKALDNAGERIAINPNDSYPALERRFEKFQTELSRAQQEMGGSREELAERELNAKNTYEKKAEEYENTARMIQILKSSLMDRRERWIKFRDYIAAHAQSNFVYLLLERSFRGNIYFNHQARTLDIQVEPDKSRRSDKGRQTKTLSGGEKSFSTICLLLSLWEAMGSPIRCLDEFDVFMDNVNRDVSMRMIIQAARRAVSRQFVFITPQSMGNVLVDTDVKIHKMRDPERGGQATLPFGVS